MNNRPSKHINFLNIAKEIAERSTCKRHKVGCVITSIDGVILSTGYNGAPRGFEHCLDIGCIRDKEKIESGKNHETCFAVHAEMNSIINAARNGVKILDGILYCTHSPCIICAKMIINSGIREIYVTNKYPDKLSEDFIRKSKIRYHQM